MPEPKPKPKPKPKPNPNPYPKPKPKPKPNPNPKPTPTPKQAHWGGPDSELLEAVVTDNCSPRIHVMRARNPHPNPSFHTHPNPSLTPTPNQVMRARNPFNPVALFTPLAESPLCAVAAETIQASEPIALYLGELTDEISLEGEGKADNTYLYALSLEEMRSRGNPYS